MMKQISHGKLSMFFGATVGCVCILCLVPEGTSAPAEAKQAIVSSRLPDDLNQARGGAPAATLEQAATHAWQTFVALNWPAAGSPRDTALPVKLHERADAPRVWETFRGRVEIYPGNGFPSSSPDSKTAYGYDGRNPLRYDPAKTGENSGEVPPCKAANRSTGAAGIPWNNLDEVNQQNVRAGLSPAGPFPGQQILVESKVNRTSYIYVVSRGWYGEKSIRLPRKRTGDYIRTKQEAPPAAAKADDPEDTQYISFPAGAIEIKAAWRRLGPHDNPSEFHVSRVRYYTPGEGGTRICYVDSEPPSTGKNDVWGLVGFHIMQKTPSAPYFIWSTFEHKNSLMAASPSGDSKPTPIEDADGQILQSAVVTGPAYTPGIKVDPATQEGQQRLAFEGSPANPGFALHYHQPGLFGIPQISNITVHRRLNPIPDEIVRANRMAHEAIRASGASTSPLMHYRLVAVQWRPVTKKPGERFQSDSVPPAIYYAANINIEAPPVNQEFSGQFAQGFSLTSDYLNREFPLSNPRPNPGDPAFLNTFFKGEGYLAGGCMGCHGFRQVYGTDWSFLLDRGRVQSPEVRKNDFEVME
jgi:hypothetical protein